MVVVSPAYSIRPMVNTQTQQEQTPSLMARDGKDPPLVSLPSYCLDRACFTSGENAQYRLSVREEVAATLIAEGPGAISASPEDYLVRRLTPLECCRLQGFPDGWTEHLGTEEPGEQEIAQVGWGVRGLVQRPGKGGSGQSRQSSEMAERPAQ